MSTAFHSYVILRKQQPYLTKLIAYFNKYDNWILDKNINFCTYATEISGVLKKKKTRLFQKFNNRKLFNRFDESKRQKIWKIRYGYDVKDSYSNSHFKINDKNLLNISDSNKEYRWKTKNLTYSIGIIPKQLSRKIIRNMMKIAFHIWSTATQLNFTEVPTNGNIKIDFVKKDHGNGYSFDGSGKVLAHSLLPPYGVIHFDIDEKWVIMNSSELSRYDTVDLLQTAVHEIGHVLGLEHSWEKNSVMSPFYHQPIEENENKNAHICCPNSQTIKFVNKNKPGSVSLNILLKK
ncbi:Matrix metalloproteinase-C [Dirofilaria immitis]